MKISKGIAIKPLRQASPPRIVISLTDAGFTLLEIMVSLAIVGGLLITLIYTLNYHLGLADRHETITVATLLAKEKMSDTEKTLRNSEGNFEKPYNDYHFSCKVTDSSFPGVLELTIVVGRAGENVTLNELVYQRIGANEKQ